MADENEKLLFVKLTDFAVAPKRSSPLAAGLDLYSAEFVDIPPGGRSCIKTDIAVSIPKGEINVVFVYITFIQ